MSKTAFKDILKQLKSQARPDQLAGMARFAIVGDKRMGIAIPVLRQMAKQIGQNHQLALKLWQTNIPEAMILASMTAEPEKVTEAQMEDWVKDINSWDVCDQTCMNLWEKTALAVKKINQWSKR